MIKQSILVDKLKSFDYYKNKLPLYLQNSYGFQEHFKIWYDFLVGNISSTNNISGIVGTSDTLLNLMNIFDSDYLNYVASMEDSGATEDEPYGTNSDILDKIGALLGVTRNFKVTINNVEEELSLNNEDFLILIKTQIIKNYCEGTLEQINAYYKSIKLQLYAINSSTPGQAILYLIVSKNDSRFSYSPNIKKMFEAGLLKIESMGIIYSNLSLDYENLLHWDVDNSVWALGDLESDEGGVWGV